MGWTFQSFGGSGVTRLRQRRTEGKQAGSLNHLAALPPLLPFGLDPDEHFEAACIMGQYPLPTERSPVSDTDLQFAAYLYARENGFLEFMEEKGTGHPARAETAMDTSDGQVAISPNRLHCGRDHQERLGVGGDDQVGRYLLSIWSHCWVGCSRHCSLLQHFPGVIWKHHHPGRGGRGYR